MLFSFSLEKMQATAFITLILGILLAKIISISLLRRKNDVLLSIKDVINTERDGNNLSNFVNKKKGMKTADEKIS